MQYEHGHAGAGAGLDGGAAGAILRPDDAPGLASGLAHVVPKSPILRSCILGADPVTHRDIESAIGHAEAALRRLKAEIGDLLSGGDPFVYDRLARVSHKLDDVRGWMVGFSGFTDDSDPDV